MAEQPVAERPDDIIKLPEVAKQYEVATSTVSDRRWRKRAGLRVVRLGGKVLGVRRADLEAALRCEF